jgi:hypothetical protein
MYDLHIFKYIWDKVFLRSFFKSCKDLFNMNNLQLYNPIYSLYFHIYNTKNSHKCIDIKRRYYIHEILDVVNYKYYHSNCLLKASIYDSKNSHISQSEIFCKIIPLLEPIYFIKNNYNNHINRNPLLPSNYNSNTFEKINNMNNTAFIDTFFSYIASELTIDNILPNFALYYGSLNGIMNNYNFDISEDYHSFKNEGWFNKNIGNHFKLDVYESDSDSDSDDSYDNSDYISVIKNMPTQLFFIQKLDGLLSDLLNDINQDIILSCIFQVSFALSYLQKHLQFTHNDLHIDNIMYQRTEKLFLYYKYNNIYFKIPTHGYIFKIIDFGRAVFTFKDKLFFSDCFSKYGDADGQYKYPIDTFQYNKPHEEICNIKPNYHFDLCRLSMTILEELNYSKYHNYKENQALIDFLYSMTIGENDLRIYELEDNFDMYVSIAKYANNALPINIIQNDIFKKYRIKKKHFPKRFSYHL